MRPDLSLMQLQDGGELAWLEVGDAEGVPVFAFHGSPGRAYEFSVHGETARYCNVRLIALDRPGYGHSTYVSRRKLSDFPSTVAQLANHLRIKTFAVLGHSQGGPHALACARFLPFRVTICAVASGLAPSGMPEMMEGMMFSNRLQWRLYRRWPRELDGIAAALGWLLSPVAAIGLRYGRRHPESGLDRFSRLLPERDVQVMSRPEIRAQLVAEGAEFTLAAVRTSIQDMALGIRDWDFSMDQIEVPVHLWHGDLDRNVPFAHGQLLATAIPHAVLHECPGEGHWLVVDHMKEILNVLASGTAA